MKNESLAILLAVDHWKAYLQFAGFIIQTKQRSFTDLTNQKLNTYWQHKAMTKLMGFQYRICYKKGCTNKVVDALSKITHNSVTLSTLSVVQPTIGLCIFNKVMKVILQLNNSFIL